MRKVTVAAMQTAEIPAPVMYDSVHDIIQQRVIPQAEVTFKMLQQAGEAGVDIITTSEDLGYASHYIIDSWPSNTFSEVVQLSVPIFEKRLSEISSKYKMNIVACYYKPYDGQVYNVAAAFNRKGEICGEYRKVHLPCNELIQVAEGNDINVIELDCARIGVMICYDMMFPATAEVLSLKGAEIVFHPTFGYGRSEAIGEATLRTRANDGSFYLVTAKDYRGSEPGKSSVIDYSGNVLVDAGYDANVIVKHTIDLDEPKTQPDWFIHSGLTGQPNMRIRHENERRSDTYGEIAKENKNKYKNPSKAELTDFCEKFLNGTYRWD